MNEQEKWQAVLARDSRCDGAFVYAVGSTGIYCRPTCPSRRPKREFVQFFDRPAQAEDAGYRPCRRCHPDKSERQEPNLALMQTVCRYIDENLERPPTLGDLAARFNLSPYHLQRTFKRIVGVTPKQYAAAQRAERLRTALRTGNTATEAIYEAGYQSGSSAYVEAGTHLGMTPDRFRRGGASETIDYAITPCPLGKLLVAATAQGICAVRLGDSETELESNSGRGVSCGDADTRRPPIAAVDFTDNGLSRRCPAAPRPPAGHPGNCVSTTSMDGFASHPVRQHALLQRGRSDYRPADCCPRRGKRLRQQPNRGW